MKFPKILIQQLICSTIPSAVTNQAKKKTKLNDKWQKKDKN